MGELRALPKSELPERAAKFLQWAREMALDHKPDMVGFVILAWDKTGGTCVSGDVSKDDNPIPTALLPSLIAEVVRRDFVTEKEIGGFLRHIGFLAPEPPDAS